MRTGIFREHGDAVVGRAAARLRLAARRLDLGQVDVGRGLELFLGDAVEHLVGVVRDVFDRIVAGLLLDAVGRCVDVCGFDVFRGFFVEDLLDDFQRVVPFGLRGFVLCGSLLAGRLRRRRRLLQTPSSRPAWTRPWGMRPWICWPPSSRPASHRPSRRPSWLQASPWRRCRTRRPSPWKQTPSWKPSWPVPSFPQAWSPSLPVMSSWRWCLTWCWIWCPFAPLWLRCFSCSSSLLLVLPS